MERPAPLLTSSVEHVLFDASTGYTMEIIRDARDFADHAGRMNVAMDDARLAVQKRQRAAACAPTLEASRYVLS